MKRNSGAPPQEVRLLGGQWKRSKLPVADRPGLRPTPSRVRETLFNWLGQDLSGWRGLDAFAGTGALGFEAASRGARELLMVEQEPALVVQLQAVRARLKAEAVRVQRGDGLAALRAAAGQGLDVVFLDPPFEASGLFEPALRAAREAVSAEGFVYLEAPRPWTEAELAPLGLALHRHGRAGAVAFHLLRPVAP
ncbi:MULTISPECIES: 16S rRNA (guanine(966)-N(2))-methyltransferase RsmD [unclassified Hydrogenophaga]|uniref:16S rRNA (guanine(966)-N(2))-methyltransferase RsmD n=1 Tax=unclassified Hydrogenophaga TaxID=2610897 RepID=UPI0008784EF2|nr:MULTISPECIES: 16S rRNA (guanine(966)-N(2))-methyltransferase RsmD [unclassified Hydrogenophaga]MBN9369628.1 16S rRNA (guanine(966)-N(2))-methyltransferase RsmD [Hydrogenophaga sp.]OJV68573.1 MAG: 16S rRNA (guanine(966)-N(2))-methyltransferase RsmD [Hydrogenophaga sp. 70-12]